MGDGMSRGYGARSITCTIQSMGGVFFPGYWLAGSLQFHVTRNVRAIVDEYLRTDATLQPGLKLKLLQAADMLMRFTDMSQGR